MECDNRSPKIASIYLGLIHTEVAASGSNADEKMKKMKKAYPSLVWYPGQNKRIAPLFFFHGCRKRRLKDVSEIDCDQTAMGLSPITSAVLLIVK
jgi:hypothetical protein